jgi:hypothetical protein
MGGLTSSRTEALVRQLEDRDWELLRFLARQRYATTDQLRRSFFLRHKNQAAATRACIRVMDRLFGLHAVGRFDRRIGGLRRGSAGYVWYLDNAGQRAVDSDNGPRHRFEDPSLAFLEHTLAVTEAVVQIAETARADGVRLSRIEVETEAWRSFLTPAGSTSILKPDVFVTLSSPDFDDAWYIEIDRGTERLQPTVLPKCRAYETYRRTGKAHAEYGVFPRVLWLVPREQRAEKLRALIAADPNLPRGLFVVATTDQLIATLRAPPDP